MMLAVRYSISALMSPWALCIRRTLFQLFECTGGVALLRCAPPAVKKRFVVPAMSVISNSWHSHFSTGGGLIFDTVRHIRDKA